MKMEDLAKVCHETLKAYNETQGDFSLVPWELMPEQYQVDTIFEVEQACRYPPVVAMPKMKRAIFRAVAGVFRNQEV